MSSRADQLVAATWGVAAGVAFAAVAAAAGSPLAAPGWAVGFGLAQAAGMLRWRCRRSSAVTEGRHPRREVSP